MVNEDRAVYPEESDESNNKAMYPDVRTKETEEPPRVIVTSSNTRGKSLIDGEEESQTLSDLKELVMALIPESPIVEINKLAKMVMMSRIFPGKYNSKHKSLVVMIMRKYPKLDPHEVWEITDDMLAIAYKGECRIDILEGYGVLSDNQLRELGNQSFR